MLWRPPAAGRGAACVLRCERTQAGTAAHAHTSRVACSCVQLKRFMQQLVKAQMTRAGSQLAALRVTQLLLLQVSSR